MQHQVTSTDCHPTINGGILVHVCGNLVVGAAAVLGPCLADCLQRLDALDERAAEVECESDELRAWCIYTVRVRLGPG